VVFHLSIGKFCVAAPDHEPVAGAAGNLTPDFASELLKRADKLVRLSVSLILMVHCCMEDFDTKLHGSIEHRQLQWRLDLKHSRLSLI
jgi:hypothetical protein